MKKQILELGRTCRAILWAFFGVRKHKSHQRDMEQIKPVYLIVVAIFLTILFICILLVLVRIAIKYATAG